MKTAFVQQSFLLEQNQTVAVVEDEPIAAIMFYRLSVDRHFL